MQASNQMFQKIMEKCQGYSDFKEVFGEHVDECIKNKKDPFNTESCEIFVNKAMKHWDLYCYVTTLYMTEK
jgi:hypothetical protein